MTRASDMAATSPPMHWPLEGKTFILITGFFKFTIPTLASNSKLRLDKELQISQTKSASKVPAKL